MSNENDAYPLRRYQTAKTEAEKKAWMDFIKYHHPELSKQLNMERSYGGGLDVKIKQLRTEKGWTQEDLGRKLGMTRVNISNYERGRIANMPLEIINQIADIFDVSADYLLGRTNQLNVDGMRFMTLGSRIKEYRLKRGLTQSKIAEKLKMTEANFSSYERDKSEPPSGRLNQIAQILSVSTDYLLGRTNYPEKKEEAK